MKQTEILRALQNVIRIGTIAEADYAHARVRVAVSELVTGWLPWVVSRAGSAVEWWAPSIGEQVVVLSPAGDLAQGIVLNALYQASTPAPDANPEVHKVVYPDGTVVEYNAQAHDLKITTVGTITIQSAGHVNVQAPSATVDAPTTTFTGDVTVQKRLTFMGGMTGSNTGGGAAASITGDMIVDGISVPHHTHADPQGGTVGQPQ